VRSSSAEGPDEAAGRGMRQSPAGHDIGLDARGLGGDGGIVGDFVGEDGLNLAWNQRRA
jgi:hypothetical protein